MTTISDIQTHNRVAGHHFFDRETMRFFNSRILEGVYGGRFFVTSERFESDPRRYTVRKYDRATGWVDSASDFQAFTTARQAIRFAVELTKEVEV